MKKEDFDNIMKEALAQIAQEGINDARKEDCMSEETISEYMEARLSKPERDRVERHLSYCLFCRSLVTTLCESEETVPVKKRESLKKGPTVIDDLSETLKVSIAWAKGHLSLLGTNGEYLPFWDELRPVLTRGDSQNRAPSLPAFSKVFGEYEVHLKIMEDEEEGGCQILCQISSISNKKRKTDMKLDLLQENRLLFSYPFTGQDVVFPGIPPGDYKIRIWEKDTQVALLLVDIK